MMLVSHSMGVNTGLKTALIALTLISVVADTMLLPFYPHFFENAFGVNDPRHVGWYIAACCVTVMCAFPVWSRVARRIHELHLWVFTQIIAAGLAVLCYHSESLLAFWLLSQTMLVFKASYLLIYPFVMRLEEREKRLGVAGLFSVLMHFGGIGGAVLGGSILGLFDPRAIYLIMAAADLVQVVICLYLLARTRQAFWVEQTDASANTSFTRRGIPDYVFKIGALSLVFYFSVFLIRPFFTRYWESLTGSEHVVLTALVYAIPAWVALLILLRNHFWEPAKNSRQLIASGGLFILVGVLFQASEQWPGVIAGRLLFGYGLFQVTVHMEVLLFELSRPEHFASDFSKVHFFQNLGVIGASFAVGSLVDHYSLTAPHYLAFCGMLATLLLFHYLYRRSPASLPEPAETAV